jgi:hypothetical protein
LKSDGTARRQRGERTITLDRNEFLRLVRHLGLLEPSIPAGGPAPAKTPRGAPAAAPVLTKLEAGEMFREAAVAAAAAAGRSAGAAATREIGFEAFLRAAAMVADRLKLSVGADSPRGAGSPRATETGSDADAASPAERLLFGKLLWRRWPEAARALGEAPAP